MARTLKMNKEQKKKEKVKMNEEKTKMTRSNEGVKEASTMNDFLTSSKNPRQRIESPIHSSSNDRPVKSRERRYVLQRIRGTREPPMERTAATARDGGVKRTTYECQNRERQRCRAGGG
ncbi:PREDICTED: uncharacterized protein LOC108550001 [Eufriesea mexicana]|uniref:uncharacterized protein LOC108550001 n=1 Tax=Eufriesea mexicana TaxID=516756 RepID=UPI00083C8F16|nr:PREDICTED: uncharacterized protein LOC108550001 [Eufriesea mexicana]